jgi:hypothetical protein
MAVNSELSDDHDALRREARRWRWCGFASLLAIVAVTYLATAIGDERVQVAGGLTILALVVVAIYCFGKAAAKSAGARAAVRRR